MTIVGNIEVYGKEKADKIMQVFLDVAGQIETRAVQYAPADLGDLRGSSATRREGDTVTVVFAIDYAAAVHEMIPKHAGEKRRGKGKKGYYWDVGKPHYLEDAFNELMPALDEALKGV